METPAPTRRPNGLAGQTSPYLLQHLYNPVDWQPWGEGALTRARLLDRPIFLSIGYAACHWCHVMERESFEDPATAALLNDWFVPVKVDREERPDLDEIYMAAVQLLTGQGGWPLNMFLTPDGRPFYGGTYWPPDERYGRASFRTVLTRVHEVWTTRRQEVERSAGDMTANLQEMWAVRSEPGPPPGRAEASAAAAELASRFDPRWGGFGPAPKFPPHGAVDLLLREHARTGEAVPRRMVERTLDAMALGGMFDQIGGGFARYSTDERWLVPHFEKMLYDQALLVPVYVNAWLLTGKPLYRRVVEDTLDFVRRELTHPEGGLWSSLDADSEGHEGRFYVWTPDQVQGVLGPDAARIACAAWDITEHGNFEGTSIPNHLHGEPEDVARLAPLREKLLQARAARVRPATDDKVLAAWNGLAVTAFARAWQAFGRPEDLRSAERAATFVLAHLRQEGRLRASWREGAAPLPAYLDDHAFLARGLLDLYECTFERRWLDEAAALGRQAIALFEDADAGGFYFTARDHERLLARTRSLHDGALPSGTGVLCETLLRLAVHLDDAALRKPVERTLAAARPAMARAASAFASLLLAADLLEGPVLEIAVAGEPGKADAEAMLRVVRSRYLPRRVVACGVGSDLPLLAGKTPLQGRAAAYLCREYACQAPTAEPEELARLLG